MQHCKIIEDHVKVDLMERYDAFVEDDKGRINVTEVQCHVTNDSGRFWYTLFVFYEKLEPVR